MNEFVINGNFEEELNNIKNKIMDINEITEVNIKFSVGNKTTIADVRKDFSKISELFSENTKIKLDFQVDDTMQENQRIIKVIC